MGASCAHCLDPVGGRPPEAPGVNSAAALSDTPREQARADRADLGSKGVDVSTSTLSKGASVNQICLLPAVSHQDCLPDAAHLSNHFFSDR